MNRKVYRLSKDTNEITEILESQAIKIIGYYYEEPEAVLNSELVIETPNAYISHSEAWLKVQSEQIKSKV